jgi:mRNA-degrading endonuclease RelE of RelBE toxin-antitoxin system
MINYQIEYLKSFSSSLEDLVKNWRTELYFSDKQIGKFIQTIDNHIQSIREMPFIHENVALIYGFDQPTYRFLIGKTYGIFYRVNEEKNVIYIGRVFSVKQMKLDF